MNCRQAVQGVRSDMPRCGCLRGAGGRTSSVRPQCAYGPARPMYTKFFACIQYVYILIAKKNIPSSCPILDNVYVFKGLECSKKCIHPMYTFPQKCIHSGCIHFFLGCIHPKVSSVVFGDAWHTKASQGARGDGPPAGTSVAPGVCVCVCGVCVCVCVCVCVSIPLSLPIPFLLCAPTSSCGLLLPP